MANSTPRGRAADLMAHFREGAYKVAKAELAETEAKGDGLAIQHARQVHKILRRYRRLHALGSTLRFTGGWIMFGGVATLGYQCYLWLHDGEWTPLPFIGALHQIGLIDVDDIDRLLGPIDSLIRSIEAIEWQGLQRIMLWSGEGLAEFLLWMITMPASVVVFLIGAIVTMVGGAFCNRRPA
jgi:hypothetical protein